MGQKQRQVAQSEMYQYIARIDHRKGEEGRKLQGNQEAALSSFHEAQGVSSMNSVLWGIEMQCEKKLGRAS